MKRVISLLICLLFVLLVITSLAMTFGKRPSPATSLATAKVAPTSQVAQPSANASPRPGPAFFPKKLHEAAGYAMLIVMAIHMTLYWRTLVGYVGLRRK